MSGTGLLGGTFDPVHNGHLELADRARRECGLTRVMLIPAAVPPHKSRDELTPFGQRVDMLRLAIADRQYCCVSEVEADIEPPSYTIDMLDALLPDESSDEYHFIIGSDAFLEVKTWKSYKRVLRTVHFIVVPRRGFNSGQLAKHIASLGYRDAGSYWYSEKYKKRLYNLEGPVTDVSSTQIRKMACGSEEMQRVVRKSVYEYIVSNGLYDCS